MKIDAKALAKKCEVRAKDFTLRRVHPDTLITVGDVQRLLTDLAKDILASHFTPDGK